MEAVYTFNEMGGQLWRLLGERRAPEDLVNWVVESFDVAPEIAAKDVEGFLADLEEIGLVQRVGLFDSE